MNSHSRTQAHDAFSCDLVHQAKCHILFLKALHSDGITLQRPSVESLRRYKDLWLPLFFENAKDGESVVKDLIPPSDIAWLWHCHRLAPYRYMDYVQTTFLEGVPTGDPKFDESFDGGKMSRAFESFHRERPFLFQSEKTLSGHQEGSDVSVEYADLCSHTKALWTKLYPHESFFLESQSNSPKSTSTPTDIGLLGDFDVLDSCERQSTFLWQVSGDRYDDNSFLLEGIDNYVKFLQLMTSSSRPKFIVPTYQIDLMWHTHMLTSITNYHKDCVALTGYSVEHNDSLTDRSEGGLLDVNFQATKKLWYESYGVDYIVKGGMYRGEPPRVYYDTAWSLSTNFNKNQQGVLPDGITLGRLIGEVGASSIGALASEVPWKNLSDTDAFIAANPKSTTSGVNANPQKEDYVFGSGVMGMGFYHMETKEAYNVLLKRIDRKIDQNEKMLMFVNGHCCSCFLTSYISGIKQNLEAHQNMREIVSLRLSSSGPKGKVKLPNSVLSLAQRYDANRYNRNDDSYYYSNPYLMGGGGGCGGGWYAIDDNVGDDGGGGSGGGGGDDGGAG